MALLVETETKHMPIHFIYDHGTDDFFFTIPNGDVYDRTEIEEVLIDHANVSIKQEPGQGSTGNQAVQLQWSIDLAYPPPAAPLRYIVRIFSKFSVPIDVPGRIILFEHANFEGRLKDIDKGDHDLTATDDGFFNDRVSSFVILSGRWKFFKDIRFEVPYTFNNNPLVLGPGLYSFVEAVGIQNDDMSSLISVTDDLNHP